MLRRLAGDERGSVVTAVLFVIPTMLVLLWFAVFAGRMVNTNQEVAAAAYNGSRAAAVTGTPGAAQVAATDAVTESLRGAGLACKDLAIDVQLAAFAAGGQVTVEVACTVDIADVTGVWAPNSRTFTQSSTAFVDAYRGGE